MGNSQPRVATPRVVLVTGCRSGIGREAAIAAAHAGHVVYAGLRDASTAGELLRLAGTLPVTAVQLDVTCAEERRAAVARILDEQGRLDVLVNNAGVALGGFLEDVEEDEVRRVFDVNVFGTFSMTRACLPALREAGGGTVLMISSMSGRFALPGLGVYAGSKFALEGLSEAWRHELAPHGVRVVLLEPGAYRTDIFGRNRALCRKAFDTASPYAPYMEGLNRLFASVVHRISRDPAEVAAKIVELIEAERPALRHPVGPAAKPRDVLLRFLPFAAIESAFGRTLGKLRETPTRIAAKATAGAAALPARARPAATPRDKEPRLRCTLLNAGRTAAMEWIVRPGGGWRTIDVPALFAVLEHPAEGVTLFDTGYSPRFIAGTEGFPYRIYRWATPVRIRSSETAVAQLRRRGLRPQAVRRIVLSHFDPDHCGGLRDFPAARIVCAREAWEAIQDKSELGAALQRVLPGHLPDDCASRLELVDDFKEPGVGPFGATHDLFGDGAIRLVPLPGHAPGQLGAFVRNADGTTWLLAADAVWSRAALGPEPAGSPLAGFVHRRLARDRAAQEESLSRLRRLRHKRPEIIVIPSHSRKAAAELLPDPENRSWR